MTPLPQRVKEAVTDHKTHRQLKQLAASTLFLFFIQSTE